MAEVEYPFSVFYISHSVFEQASKKLLGNQENKSFTFLFNAVLFNIRYKKHIGTCITFTTKQIFELAKSVDYENKFKGFMVLGENMAHGEDKINSGDKNYRLLQGATDKDTEILGDVKVVCEDYASNQYFLKAKNEQDYPIEIVNSEEALTELKEISKKISEQLGF